MSNNNECKGQCLCGSVKIHTNSMSREIGACHCDMCRKWGGSAFLGVECKSDVTFSGDEYITRYKSSEWAERGFCTKCGTHLFYRLKQQNEYIIPVGLFDTETKYNFDHQIFIDSKPEYYEFKNKTKNMTGAEVFAMFD